MSPNVISTEQQRTFGQACPEILSTGANAKLPVALATCLVEWSATGQPENKSRERRKQPSIGKNTNMHWYNTMLGAARSQDCHHHSDCSGPLVVWAD